MSEVKYPEIEVQLSGEDGNALVVMGAVRNALRRAGVAQSEIDAFTTEATSGDYDHLLQTCMRWVVVNLRTLTHEQEASLRLAKRATLAATAAVAQRNLEIISAHVHHCTIQAIADATGLSRARIHQIIHGR